MKITKNKIIFFKNNQNSLISWISIILTLVLISNLSMSFVISAENNSSFNSDIIWEANITFTAPGCSSDDVVFGEDSTAHDGPPIDYGLDGTNPPPGIPPAIDAWFEDGLDSPYNTLRSDYRYGPDTQKIWNLFVLLLDTSSNEITLKWDISELQKSEYGSIELYDVNSGSVVANMLTINSKPVCVLV